MIRRLRKPERCDPEDATGILRSMGRAELLHDHPSFILHYNVFLGTFIYFGDV